MRVDLTANSVEFRGGFEQAAAFAEKFAGRMEKTKRDVVKSGSEISVAGTIASKGWATLRNVVTGTIGAVVAYAAAGRVVKAFKQTADMVENIGIVARRFGQTTEEVSSLRFTLEQANIPLETGVRLAGFLQRNLSEAAETGKGATFKAIKDLGLVGELSSGKLRKTGDALGIIAQRLLLIKDAGRRESLAGAFVGDRSAAELVQLITDGGGYLQNYAVNAERARRLGVQFTADQVEKITEMNDAIDRIGEAWEGLKTKVLVDVAPFVTELADKAAAGIAAIPKMISRVANLVRAAVSKPDPNAVGPGMHEYALQLFSDFGQSIQDIIVESFQGAFRVVMATGPVFVNAFGDLIESDLGARVYGFIQKLPYKVAVGVNRALQVALEVPHDLLGGGPMAGETKQFWDFFQGNIDAAKTEIDQINKEIKAEQDTPGRDRGMLYQMRTLSDYPKLKYVLEDVKSRVTEAGRRFLSAADGVLGFTSAIGDTSMEVLGLTDALEGLDAVLPERNRWEEFTGGARRVLDQMIAQADDFDQLGGNIMGKTITGISEGWTDALFQADVSLSNFGSRMLKTLGDVGQMVAKVAVQFVIMRAVTAGFDYLWPGAASAAGRYTSWQASGAPNYVPGPMNPSIGGSGYRGAVWNHGSGGMAAYGAGGVHVGPTALSMPSGTHVLVGENPTSQGEFYTPAYKRNGGWVVKATGGVQINVFDNRAGGDPVQVREAEDPNGMRRIDVYIDDRVDRYMQSGRADVGQRSAYGVSRRARPR